MLKTNKFKKMINKEIWQPLKTNVYLSDTTSKLTLIDFLATWDQQKQDVNTTYTF